MAKKNALDWIALVLVIIGAINWGLFGLAGMDLVNIIFKTSIIATIIYVLVGLSGLYLIYYIMKK